VFGDLEKAKLAYDMGADIMHMSGNSFILAASMGRLPILHWMSATVPDIPHKVAYLAFFIACKYGYLEVAEWLQGKYDATSPNYLYITTNSQFALWSEELLFQVCMNGKLETAEWLMTLFPYLYADTEVGDVIFDRACQRGMLDVLKFVLEHIKSVEDRVCRGFVVCTSNGKIEIAKWLIDKYPYIYDKIKSDVSLNVAISNSACVMKWLLSMR
jgi:hypothetical protein